jgi:hypothetical protein
MEAITAPRPKDLLEALALVWGDLSAMQAAGYQIQWAANDVRAGLAYGDPVEQAIARLNDLNDRCGAMVASIDKVRAALQSVVDHQPARPLTAREVRAIFEALDRGQEMAGD